MLVDLFRRKVGKLPAPVFSWHLDIPSKKSPYKATNTGQLVQGWVLLNSNYLPYAKVSRIVISWSNSAELYCYFTEPRLDVIDKYSQFVNEEQMQCGFKVSIPRRIKEFTISLEINNERFFLRKVIAHFDNNNEAPPLLKVIEGKVGWLYLNNDTNQSVDQFKGNFLLSKIGLKRWHDFLNGLSAIACDLHFKAVLVISPAKEAVLTDFYPFSNVSGFTPIDQVIAIESKLDVVYPVNTLKNLGERSFIKTDTHWTPKGAREASIEIGEHLGFSKGSIESVFENDIYKKSGIIGDLGSKLNPPQKSELEILANFNHQKIKTYDNGLPNFGRLMVMECVSPLVNETCLIFGSSSSYFMLNYLSRFFSKTIFVHSAGNVDKDVISAVKPDFLIAQTTGRFVVQAPTVSFSLLTTINEKFSQMLDDEVAQLDIRKIIPDEGYIDSLGLTAWMSK